MKRKKKSKKRSYNKGEIWTEEQAEEYSKGLCGMEFIAGFTESGVPYGIFEEDLEIDIAEKSDKIDDFYDGIPF